MRKIIMVVILITIISTAGCISSVDNGNNVQNNKDVTVIENNGMLDVVHPDEGAGAVTKTNVEDYVRISKDDTSEDEAVYTVKADASKVVINGDVNYTNMELSESEIVGEKVTFVDYGHLSYKCTVLVEEDRLVVDEEERCY